MKLVAFEKSNLKEKDLRVLRRPLVFVGIVKGERFTKFKNPYAGGYSFLRSLF